MSVSEGDKVSILGLPEGFLTGLPADEAEFMKAAVGSMARLYRRLDGGQVEVYLADALSGTVHFAVLPEELVAAA